MQVVTLVLNRLDCLEVLLEELWRAGIRGATLLDSTGMMRVLGDAHDDLPMFGMLRHMINPTRAASKTLVMVLEDREVQTVRDVVRAVTGGLDEPDTGILFSMPVLFVDGLGDEAK